MKREVLQHEGSPIEVSSDGRSVWVNGSTGAMIGRMGPFGIDVHDTQNKGTHCLDCRPAPAENAWEAFTESMREHYGIVVPAAHKPRWCR
jgi:hypothetical protein